MKIKSEISAGGIVYKKVKSLRSKVKSLKTKDENTVWLVCQHSEHKGWVFPKGLIGDLDAQESMASAALRETKEEGGVEARIITSIGKPVVYFYTFKGQKIRKTVYYFLMEYVSGDPKNHDWEMNDALFMNEHEVRKILTYQSDKEAFEDALSLLRKSSDSVSKHS